MAAGFPSQREKGRGACGHPVAEYGEDASHPGGLKDEVRTPQTQTGAQRPAHPPDPQPAGGSGSASGTCQDPHPRSGPAGGLRIPEKSHAEVRGWREPSGQDVK